MSETPDHRETTQRPARPARPVRHVALALARFDLRVYVIGALLWMPVGVIPIAAGLLLQRIFDGLGADPAATLRLCAALVAVEVVRGLVLMTAWTYGTYWWTAAATLLRANVLRSVLTARGPVAARLPHRPGETLSRLRDDVSDTVDFVDESVSLAGGLLFSAAALGIMLSIDPLVTLVLVVPMTVISVLGRILQGSIRRLHGQARTAAAAVTATVGETFTGMLTLKTAGAERAAVDRLRVLNRSRRDAAVKDRLATDLLDTATNASVETATGLVLLLSAAAMRRGDFTVGDLALFTTYVGWLTGLPRTVGTVLARLPRTAVAVERLTGLLAPHEDVRHLAADTGVRLTDRLPSPRRPAAAAPPAPPDRLEVLDARALTVRFDGSARGLDAVDLRIPRGSLTVVTGAVGSGKTTLLRALLGLVPLDAGTIRWNGRAVDDPGTFLVPGRTAYASQVPRLFSASLRENLLLGHPGESHLEPAVRQAVFEDDLAATGEGLDTVVGAGGTRLSGGQAQRATAVRALVRRPELLVVDDLSSALDVETEDRLWKRVTAAARDGEGPATLLVVSHRPAVLRRADRIVVLDRGRVAGSGTLDALLRDCPEMRRLWHREVMVGT